MRPMEHQDLSKKKFHKTAFTGSCEEAGCVSITLYSILSCLPGANWFGGAWVSGLVCAGWMSEEPENYSCLLNKWRNSQIRDEKNE